MPGARPSAFKDDSAKAKPVRPAKVFKRRGALTNAEKDLVTQIVQDQPREMPSSQVAALARGLRRSKALIQQAVAEARDRFVEQAERYVDIHRSATENALADGDNKTAQAGAQWYLENVAGEGVRIIDKTKEEAPKGTRIIIGLALGGLTQAVSPSDESKTSITSSPLVEAEILSK